MILLLLIMVIRLATTANAAQAAIDAAAAAINPRTHRHCFDTTPPPRPCVFLMDVALYIIHESVLYQYASVPDAPPAVPAAAARNAQQSSQLPGYAGSRLEYQGVRLRVGVARGCERGDGQGCGLSGMYS